MATKSILKNVQIKNRESATALVKALERAQSKRSQKSVQSRAFSDASREDIREMFGEKNGGVQGC